MEDWIYEKALKKSREEMFKEEEERKREFCIIHRICPDCGIELKVNRSYHYSKYYCFKCGVKFNDPID